MLLFEGPNSPGALNPLLILCLAMVIEAYIGGFGWRLRWLPHPLGWAMALAGRLERRLNRPQRGERDRLARGLAVLVMLLPPAALIGVGVMLASRMAPLGWAAEMVLMVAMLSGRGAIEKGRRVLAVLLSDGVEPARRALVPLIGPHPPARDAHGVGRDLIAGTARRWVDDFAAPVFWYALFGFAGFYVQRVLSVSRRALVLGAGPKAAFAAPARHLDDLAVLPAALLAAPLLALVCPSERKASLGGAIAGLARPLGRSSRQPVIGWMLSVLDGSLGLRLDESAGVSMKPDTAGDPGGGREKLTAGDVRRSLSLMFRAGLLACPVVLVLAWLS